MSGGLEALQRDTATPQVGSVKSTESLRDARHKNTKPKITKLSHVSFIDNIGIMCKGAPV